jgi:two-component system, chemotaxis family, sensor kinase CheA
MDDEFLKEFTDEALELLDGIENDLLTIEELGEALDDELINKVFRAAHTIKGGSGFFDLENMTRLAHKSETVLDMLRTRKITANAEVTNLLLMAFDRLRDMVNNTGMVASMDISDIMTGLDLMATSFLPGAEKPVLSNLATLQTSDGKRSFEVPQTDADRASRDGRNLFWIDLDFINDLERRGITIMSFFRILFKYGEILDSRLDFEAIGGLDQPAGNTLPVRLIVAVNKDLEGMQSLMYTVEPEKIHELFLVEGETGVTDEARDSETVVVEDSEDMGAASGAGAASGEVVTSSAGMKEIVEATVSDPKPTSPQSSEPHKIAVTHGDATNSSRNGTATNDATNTARTGTATNDATNSSRNGTATNDATNTARTGTATGSSVADETLRISVGMLETLMNLAGELVLSRNQLRSAVTSGDGHMLNSAEQRINQVTSELQDVIMQTRLQPIGNVFNKFPRVVRDLARQLGKEVELEVIGKDVALDKTLIEGISDPLMHMVRNAVDHGIETVEERREAGKSTTGTVRIEARHEAGQVIIEISDDGKGLHGERIAESAVKKGLVTAREVAEMTEKEKLYLIFHAGLSTAKTVSDISGRGVGMDVVKTNLNRLGGQIEINSDPGNGSSFRIKLPLTLAIIPSLIVSVGTDRFALPQTNIRELISLREGQSDLRIERVGNSEVLILRDSILPLIRFRELAGIDAPNSLGAQKNAMEIAVITDGSMNFAVQVDWFHNTEEVVVKPLGRRLKHLKEYSGATILGDGSVALIIDPDGLATKGNVHHVVSEIEKNVTSETEEPAIELTSYLLFGNGAGEQCAVPLDMVDRIERIQWRDVENLGNKRTMQYRDGMLALFTLDDVARVPAPNPQAEPVVLVAQVHGKTVGLLGTMPVNVVHIDAVIDRITHRQAGIFGSMIVEGRTTLLADINEIVPGYQVAAGSGNSETINISAEAKNKRAKAVLLAEDSDFFRSQVKRIITEKGYQVIDAPDGEQAWTLLLENLDDIQMVVTDVEMPNLDGLDLTRRIRSDHRTTSLPIIAVSSLAAEEDMLRGIEAGVTEYQVKLDREKLLASIDALAELSIA